MVTSRSMNKLALLVRSCGVEFLSVMTLTYGQNYPMNGRETKKHLNNFLVASRRLWGAFEYVWVLEFQQRGAVHFHVATTLAPPTDAERHEFALVWTRISVPGDWLYCELFDAGGRYIPGQTLGCMLAGYMVHSHHRSWEPIKKLDGVGRYFAKYANKLRQKKPPSFYRDVGRFWGASRGVKMPDGEYLYGTDSQIRDFVELRGRNVETWQVLPKIILLG